MLSQRTLIAKLLTLACLTGCGGGGGGGGGGDDGIASAAVAGSKESPAPAPAETPHPKSGCTVELYGDSIMERNGSAETPVMTLRRVRPGLEVVADHSRGGTQLAALETDFASHARSARIVVIENGVIDAWSGLPRNNFTAALHALILRVRAEGRTPVLTGYSRQVPNPALSFDAVARRDAYDALARSVANGTGTDFADWGAAPFEGAADLVDGLHPNKAYSDRLIERLAITLDKVAPECVPVQGEPQAGQARP